MKPIAYIDLFSGIGGFALALHGFAKPVVFCEIETSSQEVLLRQMKSGKLLHVPIAPDIRYLDGNEYAGKARMVAGGSPCIGFSPVGLRKGFEDPQSGLMGELLRIVDEVRPDLVFLENVPNIINSGMDVLFQRLGKDRGFNIFWTVLSASSQGAKHVRRRCFILCVQPGTKMTWTNLPTLRSYWNQETVHRMQLKRDPFHKQRLGMLGNAVVPAAARAAFHLLASGWRQTHGKQLVLRAPVDAIMVPASQIHLASSGAWLSGKVFRLPTLTAPDPGLDEKLRFKQIPRHLPMRVSTEVLKKLRISAWSTPRTSMTEPCNILTERSIRDLPTQVKFASSTPKKLRGGYLSPEWCEWLMGFPLKWTKLTPH